MMISPSADHDHDYSHEADTLTPTDTSATSGHGADPLWLLVVANALFFAFAAALLAAG